MAKFASLVLILALGAAFAGCGEEDRSHLLPGDSVSEIEANIDTVQRQVEQGLCLDALESANDVLSQAESLPPSVDADLKRALIDGAVTLIQRVQDNCEESGAVPTDEAEPVETEPEETTGDAGTGEAEEEPSGPTGSNGNNQGNPNRPDRPDNPTPEPDPEPTPPEVPETPTQPETPVDPGPGSGGISPNP